MLDYTHSPLRTTTQDSSRRELHPALRAIPPLSWQQLFISLLQRGVPARWGGCPNASLNEASSSGAPSALEPNPVLFPLSDTTQNGSVSLPRQEGSPRMCPSRKYQKGISGQLRQVVPPKIEPTTLESHLALLTLPTPPSPPPGSIPP